MLDKNDLENLRIAYCEQCEHPTLQQDLQAAMRLCLICGTIFNLEWIESEAQDKP